MKEEFHLAYNEKEVLYEGDLESEARSFCYESSGEVELVSFYRKPDNKIKITRSFFNDGKARIGRAEALSVPEFCLEKIIDAYKV